MRTTVNGTPMTLRADPGELLLDVLRDELGLTGAKRSCDVQVCGTCTVLIDGAPGERLHAPSSTRRGTARS